MTDWREAFWHKYWKQHFDQFRNENPQYAFDARPRARNQELSEIDADGCLQIVRAMLSALPPEERDRLLDGLDDLVAGASGAEDEPAPYPGRPRTGGEHDPLDTEAKASVMPGSQGAGRAQDGRRRMAADSLRGFARRYPGAKRITAY